MAGFGLPQASVLADPDLATYAGTTPGAGGLAVIDDASTDAILTTLGFPTTFIHAPGQRVWRPACQAGGNFTNVGAVAYFHFLGQVARAVTPKYVRAHMVTAGASTQAAEVGLFTTPLPPNAGNQTLTPLAAFTATVDDLTAAGPLVRGNTSAFATALTVGQFLWAGIRVDMASTEPVFLGGVNDALTGGILVKTSAGAFDGATTYAGVVPAISAIGTPVAPYLWVGFD